VGELSGRRPLLPALCRLPLVTGTPGSCCPGAFPFSAADRGDGSAAAGCPKGWGARARSPCCVSPAPPVPKRGQGWGGSCSLLFLHAGDSAFPALFCTDVCHDVWHIIYIYICKRMQVLALLLRGSRTRT